MHMPDRGLKENFFRTDGRLNRKRYFLRNVVLAALGVLLLIFFSIYIGMTLIDTGEGAFAAFLHSFMTGIGVFMLLCTPLIISHLTLTVRRLHDVGMSGWYLLFLYVPLVNVALGFYLLFKEGQSGANAYGDDPRALPAAANAGDAQPSPPADAEPSLPAAAAELPDAPLHTFSDLRFFSMKGRLSRRDFALTLGAICGGQGLLFALYDSLVLPLNYLVAASLFRDATPAFWGLTVTTLGAAIFLMLLATPFLGVSAVVRRLHDMGRSGLCALPAFLAILTIIFIPVFYILIWGVSQAYAMGIPLTSFLTDFMHWSIGGNTLPYILLGSTLIGAVLLLILIPLNGWLFFGSGDAGENAYGAPPSTQPLPGVRTAFLSRIRTINYRNFRFSALLVCAAANFILMFASNLIINPLCIILMPAGILPYGSDYYFILLLSSIYPLAALPLVLRRLKTLGRSAYEALFVYAALLPTPVIVLPIAHFYGELDRLNVEAALSGTDEIDPTQLLSLLSIEPSSSTIACAALTLVCGIVSIVSVVRLTRD